VGFRLATAVIDRNDDNRDGGNRDDDNRDDDNRDDSSLHRVET